jgi:hypothetical protein
MSNITLNLLHGIINSTHTSTLTPYYPPSNLPTPWPLLVVSVLLSLLISCFGCKAAVTTRNAQPRLRSRNYTGRDRPRSARARKESAVCETELYSLHKPENPDIIAPPPYEISGPSSETTSKATPPSWPSEPEPGNEWDASSVASNQAIPEPEIERLQDEENFVPDDGNWTATPLRKAIDVFIVSFCTFRALVAFSINVQGLIDNLTPPCSSSNVLLLLVSIQVTFSNNNLPKIFRTLLAINVLLAMAAFLIAAYAWLAVTSHPGYGQLEIAGGNCPVYANNCPSQMKGWIDVGCGNWTIPDKYNGNNDLTNAQGDPLPEGNFYDPYATPGDLNSGLNAMFIVEVIISVCGTALLPFCLGQLYGEVRDRFRGLVHSKKPRGRLVDCMLAMIMIFGLLGAFCATWMTIGAHISQETGHHHTYFIDGFGPVVPTNVTYGGSEATGGQYITSTDYWGNSTSWSDCFEVQALSSVSGFWDLWVKANSHSLYRIAAGM